MTISKKLRLVESSCSKLFCVHAKNYNHSLGICYEGGLNAKGVAEDTRTEAQKHALYALVKCLRADYPKARIVGHCELPHVTKPCPCFPASKEYAELQPK